MHRLLSTTFKFQKLQYADCHARARGSEKLMRAVANIDPMKLNVSSAAVAVRRVGLLDDRSTVYCRRRRADST